MFTVISSVLLHFHSCLCSYVLWCFCIFLSDASEVNDGQKRRRLEASGQENRSPKPSSSGRIAELETKPDTPMVPSVRSRVQELTQRRGGNPTLEVLHQHLPKKTNSTKTWTLNGCWIKLYLFGSEKLVIECICVRIQTHEKLQFMLAGFMVPLKIVVRHGSQGQHSNWIISTQDEGYCQGVEQSVWSCCDCDVR